MRLDKIGISILLVLLSLPGALAIAGDFVLVPPLAQDRGSFGAFGYPGACGFNGYGDGYGAYQAGAAGNYAGAHSGGFYAGVGLGAFAAAEHPQNYHVDLDHLRRVAEQSGEIFARTSSGLIELNRVRVEAETNAIIAREYRAGFAQAMYAAKAAAAAGTAASSPAKTPIVAKPAYGLSGDAVTRGQRYVSQSCVSCHSTGGTGHAHIDLSNLAALSAEQWDSVLRAMYSGRMPQDGEKADHKQYAEVQELKSHLLQQAIQSTSSPLESRP